MLNTITSSDIQDDLDEVNVEEQLEYLRATNKRLARENARLKVTKHELAYEVQRNVTTALKELTFPKVPKPKLDKRKKTEEVALAVLSDWQLGKKTLDYNVQACEERLELYGDKLLRITEVQRADHPVRELRVWLLGDMVEGELIFPGQAHLLDASLYRQVSVDGPRILTNFLRRMLGAFDRIHVAGVVGNHGRIGAYKSEIHPETNADRMLYSNMWNIFQNEDRITWNIQEEEVEGKFYVTEKVGKKNYLLLHGHQIQGAKGVPTTAIDGRIKGWFMGVVKEPFDYALMGHFHTPTRLTVNTATVWVNGTTESSNGFAHEKLAAAGRPCQYLLFSHPEHGVSAEYCVFLDHE